MGHKYASLEWAEKELEEKCLCEKFSKYSVVNPSRIEKKCGLDHSQAEVGLEYLTPLKRRFSKHEYGVCPDPKTKRYTRRLFISSHNPTEMWLDDPTDCQRQAIEFAEKTAVRTESRCDCTEQKESVAAGFAEVCTQHSEETGESLALGLIAGAGISLAIVGLAAYFSNRSSIPRGAPLWYVTSGNGGANVVCHEHTVTSYGYCPICGRYVC